jgi:hypothetical protein
MVSINDSFACRIYLLNLQNAIGRPLFISLFQKGEPFLLKILIKKCRASFYNHMFPELPLTEGGSPSAICSTLSRFAILLARRQSFHSILHPYVILSVFTKKVVKLPPVLWGRGGMKI